MRIPKTVPPQLPTSPMFKVSRRLPSYSGTQVSVSLDERSHNAFLALCKMHRDRGTGVLRTLIDLEIRREPIAHGVRLPTYSLRLWALAYLRGTTKSAVMRDVLRRAYRAAFGRDPEGRVYRPRVQQFESLRQVYYVAYDKAIQRGETSEQAQEAAQKAARDARSERT